MAQAPEQAQEQALAQKQAQKKLQKPARLFVGQLNFNASENDIRDIFSFYGHVLSVNVLKDKSTNRSKGSAFVEYGSTDEADWAIRALHNRYYMLRDRALQVSYGGRSDCYSDFGYKQAIEVHLKNNANPPPVDRQPRVH